MNEASRARARTWASTVLLEKGRAGTLLGLCHSPLIPPGRSIRIARRPARVGEVVVVRDGDRLIAHRLVAKANGTVLLRPDRPGQGVQRFDENEVVGVWEPSKGVRDLVLKASVGRVISAAGIIAGRPRWRGPIRAAVHAMARVRLPGGRVELVLETGDPEQLLVVLSRLALLSSVGSLGTFEDDCLGDSGFVFTARRGGGFVGAHVLRPTAGGLVCSIAVKAGYQGRGIGARLVSAAVSEAGRRDRMPLYATIRRDNLGSRKLYTGAGFELEIPGFAVHPGSGTPVDRFLLR